MKKLALPTILISFALLWSSAVFAACPRTSACPRWNAITKWTDGSTAAAGTIVRYQIFRVGTDGALLTTSALSAELQRQPKGRQCYVVVTIFTVSGVDYVSSPSAVTDQTCRLIRSPAPTDGAIERPTNGALEPR